MTYVGDEDEFYFVVVGQIRDGVVTFYLDDHGADSIFTDGRIYSQKDQIETGNGWRVPVSDEDNKKAERVATALVSRIL